MALREFVDRLVGEADEKKRLKVILQTFCQHQRIQQASADLGVTPQRLHTLREVAMQAALDALRRRRMGRPRRTPTSEQKRIEALERENARLRAELDSSLVREQVAVLLSGRHDRGEKKRNAAARAARGAGP